jgi:hypothetical protein
MVKYNQRLNISQLLQFLEFTDKIRYYLFKYSENRFVLLAYVVASIAVLAFVYRLLARRK